MMVMTFLCERCGAKATKHEGMDENLSSYPVIWKQISKATKKDYHNYRGDDSKHIIEQKWVCDACLDSNGAWWKAGEEKAKT